VTKYWDGTLDFVRLGTMRLARAPFRIFGPGLCLAALGCGSPSAGPGTAAPSPAAAASSAPLFVDATAASGLDFVHFNGMSGAMYMPEMMGGGSALLDYDHDGDLDVFVTQGRMLGAAVERATLPPRHQPPFADRLYRNDLRTGADGIAVPRFVDVTAASGLAATKSAGYPMGVAAGDYDGDGRTDLYVLELGANRLLRNLGNGAFQDVTARAGVADPRWSVSGSFFDYDRDGRLDLFVANYVDFRLERNKVCHSPAGTVDYCGPDAYEPLPNSLFRNRGDGTFEDVSARSGIRGFKGSSLGVITADFDANGWMDVYVANDKMANELWLNDGKGGFRNEALIAGVAVNEDGRAVASMGVDAADCAGAGREELFMTNMAGEGATLYIQSAPGVFEDRTRDRKLTVPSLPFTGFGAFFFDYDLDGWLDLFVANGLVGIPDDRTGHDPKFPLDQRNQLFHNKGGCAFEDASAAAGPALALSEVSRGASVGDLDNDGDPDIVVVNNAGPARVLLNLAGAGRRWIGLRLVDGGRDAIGAQATVQPPAGPALRRRVRTDGSYASARDPRLLFGLAGWTGPVDVTVDWPGGGREVFRGLPVDRYATLARGSAAAPRPGP
jgi:hypothetical protein